MLAVLYFILVFITSQEIISDDYWVKNYDKTQNCKQGKLISKLKKQKNKNGDMIRCAIVGGIEDEKERWEKCRKELMGKLVDICGALNIVEVRTENERF